jgi:hypothetical protein
MPTNRRLPSSLVNLLLLVLSCSGSRQFESAVVERIHKCPARSNCRFAMTEVTRFDWDRFCAFKYTATASDRRKALGVQSRRSPDLQRQFVFMKGDRIVFSETEPTNVEHPIRDELIFEMPDAASFRCFARNASFQAIERAGSQGRYFLLRPRKND